MKVIKATTKVQIVGFFLSLRCFVTLTVFAAFVLVTSSCSLGDKSIASQKNRIPVIFDTDICDDIDDTWALALLVQSPEFEVKLITTAIGNTSSKAKTIAKFLQKVGRTDIPIGIGVQQSKGRHRQDAWAEDYKLSSYPGTIYEDGVQALIDTIMNSPRPLKLIAVGPLPNIAAALEREPKIVEKAEFVGMHGSVYQGCGDKSEPEAEYNVKAFVKEAQKVFSAPWNMTITPLDTCGIVQLKDQKYQKIAQKNSPLTMALMENYRAWYKQGILNEHKDLSEAKVNERVEQKLSSSSTTLFDTVGIYLAMSTELVKIEKLKLIVTDDGFTRINENGKSVDCAVEWKDLGAFEDFLVDRLTK